MDYILLCYCSNGTGKVEGDNMWQIEKASHPVHIVRLDECLSAKGLAQFCCLPIPEHTADDMAIISLFIPWNISTQQVPQPEIITLLSQGCAHCAAAKNSGRTKYLESENSAVRRRRRRRLRLNPLLFPIRSASQIILRGEGGWSYINCAARQRVKRGAGSGSLSVASPLGPIDIWKGGVSADYYPPISIIRHVKFQARTYRRMGSEHIIETGYKRRCRRYRWISTAAPAKHGETKKYYPFTCSTSNRSARVEANGQTGPGRAAAATKYGFSCEWSFFNLE